MSVRQIVLDTETTGIHVAEGHRIIEIGCLEMIDRKLTGREFHYYLNPEREVEASAIAVHGITNEFLKDKPFFSSIAASLVEFIEDAELIIHNAPFDVGFLNHELFLTRGGWKNIADYCRILDTLLLARKRHVGQRNSLDALCKRYGVDNTKREFHGALLDAYLLSQVYLHMTGGQGSFFDALAVGNETTQKDTSSTSFTPIEKHQLVILSATETERMEHEKYLKKMKERGKCLWLSD